MSRWLALLLAVALWAGVSRASAAPNPIPEVIISGGGLPHAVHLAPADADAFQRRVNRPPHLQDTPAPTGPSYTVTTAYWQLSFLPDKDKDESDKSVVSLDATYWPEGGYVLYQADGHDVWIVINLLQRAVLNHYITYATLHLQQLPADPSLSQAALHPSAILVVFLAYFGVGEPVGVQLGDRALTQGETQAFLASIAPLFYQVRFLDPPQPPKTESASGYWITITLAEGRSLEYFYDTSAKTLTDRLGTEMFDLKAGAGGGIPDSAQTAQIEQSSPAGSQLWWPVMIGGGLLALGLAIWWQRRFAR